MRSGVLRGSVPLPLLPQPSSAETPKFPGALEGYRRGVASSCPLEHSGALGHWQEG